MQRRAVVFHTRSDRFKVMSGVHVFMRNDSPLRYPGGKSRISDFMREVVLLNGCRKHYVEPFAGGAGVALSLLYDSTVDMITINDKDSAVSSFWWSAVYDSEEFCNKIENVPITVEEWKRQRDIQCDETSSKLDIGFSTFFLNRTNRSGVIDAGPIGGHDQKGNYKIDARFNKDELILRVKKLGRFRDKINVTDMDAGDLIKHYLPKLSTDCLVYLDPPYLKQGPNLYLNHFTYDDHRKLSKNISSLTQKWVVSYDNQPDIRDLYSQYSGRTFSINYSVVNGREGSEVMFFSKNLSVPEQMSIVNGANRVLESNIKSSAHV